MSISETSRKRKVQVLIVDAGPVGLTLAIDLGQRGIDVLIVEKQLRASRLPKMERCHPRTMEIFARLGIAERVRAIGYRPDDPLDAFFVKTLAEPPIASIPRPSVNQVRRQTALANDGTAAAEPYQIVSQYAIEPLLREVAESTPGVRVAFGCELIVFTEGESAVTASLRHASGEEEIVEATYMVGTDGGASTVRQALGIELQGEPNVHRFIQAQFRCEELFERIPKGAHYYRADGRWGFLITQGDCTQFTLHAEARDASEMPRLFEELVGFPVKYEMLYAGPWTMRLMLAERYASRRIFLAGDSAHLVTPIGGLGMNTGIGDAIDISWKLAAVLKGWGGKHLLETYEAERRPIGWRNVKTSERGYVVRRGWSEHVREVVSNGDISPDEYRALGEYWKAEHRKGSLNLLGISQGYRYLNSPILWQDPVDDESDQAEFGYVPTTLPGARIPHIRLKDGRALQNLIQGDFTLLCRKTPTAGLDAFAKAFGNRGATFSVLELGEAMDNVAVYDRDFYLIRPDLHICWRGDEMPNFIAALVEKICGDNAFEPEPSGRFEITLADAARTRAATANMSFID